MPGRTRCISLVLALAIGPSAIAGESACEVLYIRPAESARPPVNTMINMVYRTNGKDCGQPTLATSTGDPVAVDFHYRNEWKAPEGEVAGIATFAPRSDLQGGGEYVVTWGGAQAGFFKVESESRRGISLTAVDQPVTFEGLPQAALIQPDVINGALRAIVTHLVGGRQLVADALLKALAAEAPTLSAPGAHHAARVKRITYTSAGPGGEVIPLSGLLVYPESVDGAPMDYSKTKLVLGHHGTIKSGKPAPSSAQTLEIVFALMAAGRGYIYFEPDLAGVGPSPSVPSQAYLVTHDTGSASQDMLLAVRDHFLRTYSGTRLDGDVSITGASQGGFSTFASLPYVSAISSVRGVYAAEGPYNIFQSIASGVMAIDGSPRDDYSRLENLAFVPGHLRSILSAYRAYQGLEYGEADVFQPDGTLTPEFIDGFPAAYPDIASGLAINSMAVGNIRYHAPGAEVVLFHYSRDTLVPAQNTIDMLAYLSNGAHAIGSATRGNCYEGSLFVKLFLTFDRSVEATHVVCGLFYLDQTLAKFPAVPAPPGT